MYSAINKTNVIFVYFFQLTQQNRIGHAKMTIQFSNIKYIDHSEEWTEKKWYLSRWKVWKRQTHRDEGAESFNSHSSWPGQRGGRRLQAVVGRSRVSIPDYWPTIFCIRFHSVRKVSGRWSDSPGSTSISRDPWCRSDDMAPAPICKKKRTIISKN